MTACTICTTETPVSTYIAQCRECNDTIMLDNVCELCQSTLLCRSCITFNLSIASIVEFGSNRTCCADLSCMRNKDFPICSACTMAYTQELKRLASSLAATQFAQFNTLGLLSDQEDVGNVKQYILMTTRIIINSHIKQFSAWVIDRNSPRYLAHRAKLAVERHAIAADE